MDDGLIKLLVVAVFLFLSFVSKQLEKKARDQRRGGGPAPRRKTGLEALAELEKKLREAQRAAEAKARARQGEGGPGDSAAQRPRPVARPTPPPAPPIEEDDEEAPRAAVGAGAMAGRHLETHVGGLEGHHLQDTVEARHLDLDVTKARDGHAPIDHAQPDVMFPIAGLAAAQRAPGARLPARLTELQRALVWSEILGRPVALRDGSGGQS